ncbi:MAG: hypothetical protein AAF439_08120 [Pseudomonadota bacterium]
MFEIVQLEKADDAAISPWTRRLTLLWGVFLLTVGAFLAVIFTIAIYHEIRTGTIFGLGICLLLVTFGVLMTRDGIAKITGYRIRLAPIPGPRDG